MTTAQHIFGYVDRKDPHGLLELFAEDATMVFDNGEPLQGHPAILAANLGFMSSIQGLRHRITARRAADRPARAAAAAARTAPGRATRANQAQAGPRRRRRTPLVW
ncbi:MAG: hypothetical protein JWQ81_7726 [Amycolatopsis sp.]|uniref:nuclear transport factor 2 family protein n=1 Tax=Amycolatopsis sp. TaxID=37632 RepID=UPI002617D194|nr:nuclear transport factor 2 family protein [Amycolatopsis sp.]MCU1686987.1 hypothetical protein [Amycolatopsis sp.]